MWMQATTLATAVTIHKHNIHTLHAGNNPIACRNALAAGRQTDIQTDRQTDRQVDRPTDRQTDRRTEKHSHTHTYRGSLELVLG